MPLKFNPLVASPFNLGLDDTGPAAVGGADSGLLEATLTNKSGAATTEGYVYRLDPDNDESFYLAAVELTSAAYDWTAGTGGANEYYCVLAAGGAVDPAQGNPKLIFPLAVFADLGAGLVELVRGIKASLNDHEWDFENAGDEALGTHDGANNNATLADSGESWTADQWNGRRVFNLTDTSNAYVSDTGTTRIIGTLREGVGDDWDAGDSYGVDFFALYFADATGDPDASGVNIYVLLIEDAPAVVATSSSIANNASGTVYKAGVVDIYCDGRDNPERGDFLYFSPVPGQARVMRERKSGCIGRVIEGRSGAGLCACELYGQEVIRRWDIHDYDGWRNVITVPVWKSWTEPVQPCLTNGDVGTYDDYACMNPFAMLTPDGKVVDFWYTGAEEDGFGPGQDLYSICHAQVPVDEIIGGIYEKNSSNPLLSYTPATWEQTDDTTNGPGLRLGGLVYDKYEADPDKRIKLFYHVASSAVGADCAVGLAYVDRDYNITKYGANPVIDDGGAAGDPSGVRHVPNVAVIQVGRVIFITYPNKTEKQLSVGYSLDGGLSFTYIGLAVTFANGYIFGSSWFQNMGWYYILFGRRDAVNIDSIQMEINSTNLFNAAEYYAPSAINPLVTETAATWMASYIISPCLRAYNGQFYLWFQGGNATPRYSIGVTKMGPGNLP